MMETKVVAIKDIGEVKYTKGHPANVPIKKEEAKALAESMKANGQIHPIVVRKNNDTTIPFPYVVVCGRTRIAGKKLLGEDQIWAALAPDGMSDREAESMAIAENAFRRDVDRVKKAEAVKQWTRMWLEDHPEANVPRGVAGARARKTSTNGEPNGASAHGADAVSSMHAPAGPVTTLREHTTPVKAFASLAGVSERTAAQKLKVANNFTSDQVAAAEAASVNDHDLEKIAAVKDADARSRVLNLVISGLPVDQAVESEAPGTKAKARGATAKSPTDSMPDETWITQYCGDMITRIKHPDRFKRSAILYRRTRDARNTLKESILADLKAIIAEGNPGPFARFIKSTLYATHPSQWFVCDECKGNCFADGDPTKPPCKKCVGDGFRVQTEQIV